MTITHPRRRHRGAPLPLKPRPQSPQRQGSTFPKPAPADLRSTSTTFQTLEVAVTIYEAFVTWLVINEIFIIWRMEVAVRALVGKTDGEVK